MSDHGTQMIDGGSRVGRATTRDRAEGRPADLGGAGDGHGGRRLLASGVLLGVTLLSTAGGCGNESGSGPEPPGGGPDGAGPGSFAIGVVGGRQEDQVRDVALDAQGNLYLSGVTRSDDFPVTSGAYQTEFNPGTRTVGGTEADAFVVKLSSSGELEWSTLVGGPHHDRTYGMEVDDQGFVYIAGRAGPAFPTTAGVLQPQFGGGSDDPPYGPQDGFVCKLAPDGASVVFCTYFGGSDNTIVRDIVVDDRGDIYIASARASGTYPASIAGAFTNGTRGDIDAVLAKISSDGSRVLWATYLGGSDREGNTNSVRLDAAGNPYFIYGSRSCDIPEIGAGAAQPTCGGGGDIIVSRLDPASGAVVWSTYLGGSGNEGLETHELAVAADGTVFVAAGTSSSQDFPIVGNVFQTSHGGGTLDIFVARISSDGSTLEAATLLGGSENDDAQGIAVNAAGDVFLTGSTQSGDFPVTAAQALQADYGDGRDMVVVRLSPGLDRLMYSSFLGGGQEERGRAAAVRGDLFLFGGATESSNWPAAGGAFSEPGSRLDAAFGAVTIPD